MHTHTNARFIVVVGLPSFSVTDDEVFLSFLKRTYNPPADADLCWKNSLPKRIFIILQRSTAEIMQHVASCLCSVGSVDGLTTRDACWSWYFMITMCEWWWNDVSGVHHDQELGGDEHTSWTCSSQSVTLGRSRQNCDRTAHTCRAANSRQTGQRVKDGHRGSFSSSGVWSVLKKLKLPS